MKNKKIQIDNNYYMFYDVDIPQEIIDKMHTTASKLIRDKQGNIIIYEH